MSNGADWEVATTRAHTQQADGAVFHRTIRPDLWWVDPATRGPSTFWVTGFADGCFSCVCTTFLPGRSPSRPCSHIARVCIETRATTPMIYTENPACTGEHDKVVKGYTKQALHHPQCGCSG